MADEPGTAARRGQRLSNGLPGSAVRTVSAVGAALCILGAGVLALFAPPYLHAALRISGSAGLLGLSEAATRALSDRTIHELVFGPASFAFPEAPGGPRFYDAAEAAHLRDASNLLHAFLVVVGVGALALVTTLLADRHDPHTWRAIATGVKALAAAVVVLGVFFAVAFDAAFTLFHKVFFPQGDWSFNPLTERMVQLYPTPFWQLLSMTLVLVVLALCALVWAVATMRAAALEQGRMAKGPSGVAAGSATAVGPRS